MLLDDIADLLTTGGMSETFYKAWMPEQPDQCIGLYETDGLGPINAMSSGPGASPLENPVARLEVAGVQVIGRDSNYQTLRLNMQEVYTYLNGVSERTINSTRYSYISAQQVPFGVGRDETGRSMMSLNLLAYKTISTG
jgi:hypothetical protein